jgi:hypothetical protein
MLNSSCEYSATTSDRDIDLPLSSILFPVVAAQLNSPGPQGSEFSHADFQYISISHIQPAAAVVITGTSKRKLTKTNHESDIQQEGVR